MLLRKTFLNKWIATIATVLITVGVLATPIAISLFLFGTHLYGLLVTIFLILTAIWAWYNQ